MVKTEGAELPEGIIIAGKEDSQVPGYPTDHWES